MSRIRHWRQHWDCTAPMLFAKKLKLGRDGYVLPGDEVTQDCIELLGLHRLRIWFSAGMIVRADQPLPPAIQRIINKRITFPRIEKGIGSWYLVTMSEGEEPIKVNGKRKLEEMGLA